MRTSLVQENSNLGTNSIPWEVVYANDFRCPSGRLDYHNLINSNQFDENNKLYTTSNYSILTSGRKALCYTVPEDGWLNMFSQTSSKYSTLVQLAFFFDYTKGVIIHSHSDNSQTQLACFFPVRKLDKVFVSTIASSFNMSYTNYTFRESTPYTDKLISR